MVMHFCLIGKVSSLKLDKNCILCFTSSVPQVCHSNKFHNLPSFYILDLQLFQILTSKSGGRVANLSTSRQARHTQAIPLE